MNPGQRLSRVRYASLNRSGAGSGSGEVGPFRAWLLSELCVHLIQMSYECTRIRCKIIVKMASAKVFTEGAKNAADKPTRGNIWSPAETDALLAVWGEATIQKDLEGMVRNDAVYQKVSANIS